MDGIIVPTRLASEKKDYCIWRTSILCANKLTIEIVLMTTPAQHIVQILEFISKVFSDEISRLFIPYVPYESETFHRVLSQ